jgi:PEP-CTERM motif
LAEVDLDLYDLHSGLHGRPSLQILRTISGVPSANPLDVLATIALPEFGSPQLVAVDVSSFGIAVNVGDILAIALDASYDWISGDDRLMRPMYPGGMVFVDLSFGAGSWLALPSLDAGFQSFVDTPEPASLALLIVGLFAIAALRQLRVIRKTILRNAIGLMVTTPQSRKTRPRL